MRHVTREETEALIKRIKEEVPGVALRTTMLVGFPCETETDYEELKQFVMDTKFERLGVFPFSNEEGTYAYTHFKDDVPEDVKQVRADEIMEIQQQISAESNRQKIGNTLKVIIDKKEGDFYIGRTESDSPEVDGEVLITSAEKLKNGDFVNVKITGSEDYDLFGEVV